LAGSQVFANRSASIERYVLLGGILVGFVNDILASYFPHGEFTFLETMQVASR